MKQKAKSLGNLSVFMLAMLCCVLIVSCYPEFKHSLKPTNSLKIDHSILGRWRTTVDGNDQEILIYARKSQWLDIVYIYDINNLAVDSGLKLIVLEGYTVSMPSGKFLCVRLKNDCFQSIENDNNKDFLIFNYSFSDKNELVIRILSSEMFESLIGNGKLEGVIEKGFSNGTFVYRIQVTASSEDLSDVFSKIEPNELLRNDEYKQIVFFRKR